MISTSASITADYPPVAAKAAPAAAEPSFFRQLLSELNPLQYVPVVGTIYRAATGDTIPETARFAGSLVVSGLTGGPIGVAVNVGSTLLEHALGIDPEKIGGDMLASIGIGGHASTATATAAAPAPATAAATSNATAATNAPAGVGSVAGQGWSVAQLQAYGITAGADGTLKRGDVSGADVLNNLEIAQLNIPEAGHTVMASNTIN